MFAGNRLKILRKRKNLTQNDLSDALGFEAIYGYKRIGQYEREQRHPKEKIITKLSDLLSVNPTSLMVPDVPTYDILMQLFFALEDEAGFSIHKNDNGFYFTLNKSTDHYINLEDALNAWLKKAEEHRNGIITNEEYNEWRYNYPDSAIMDLKSELDSCWDKVQEENAEQAGASDTETIDEHLAKAQAIMYEHYSKHPEDASEEYFAEHSEILDNKDNNE